MERRKYGEGTIRLHENGLWEGRIIVRKNGYKPVIKYAYEKTYEECEKRLEELKIEYGVIDQDLYAPDMLFQDWVEIWLLYTSSRRSESTTKSYKSMLKNHILPMLGERQLNKITTGVLERFYADLLKNGRLVHCDIFGEGLSVNMVRSIHRLLVSILTTAKENDLIKVNPGTKARIPIQHKASKKIFTNEELRKILCVAKEKGLYELILFALCTGMERGELCALQWKDIRLKNGEVKIYQALAFYHRDYRFEPLRKPSQYRKIVLSPKLIKILKAYKKANPSLWVFPSMYGKGQKPRNPATLTTEFSKMLRAAGISDGSFKSLRDTYAVMCLDNGMDIRTLSSILGYGNVKTVKQSFVPYMSSKKLIAANKMEGAMASIKTLYGENKA